MTMIIDGTVGVTFPDTTIQPIAAYPAAGVAVYENAQTISANYTMTAGRNGQSAGPITIATGYTVTIPDGSNWVIS